MSDLDWFVRRDGSTFPVSYVSVPIEMTEGRGAVVAFIVDGEVWGAMSADSTDREPLPDHIEDRLA